MVGLNQFPHWRHLRTSEVTLENFLNAVIYLYKQKSLKQNLQMICLSKIVFDYLTFFFTIIHATMVIWWRKILNFLDNTQQKEIALLYGVSFVKDCRPNRLRHHSLAFLRHIVRLLAVICFVMHGVTINAKSTACWAKVNAKTSERLSTKNSTRSRNWFKEKSMTGCMEITVRQHKPIRLLAQCFRLVLHVHHNAIYHRLPLQTTHQRWDIFELTKLVFK